MFSRRNDREDVRRRLEMLACEGDMDAARELARLDRRAGHNATQRTAERAATAGVPMTSCWVHSSRLEDFEKKLKRFQRKAVKAGLSEPEAVETDVESVPICRRDPDDPRKVIIIGYHTYHTFQVAFPSYSVGDGWRFIGTVDHPRKAQGDKAQNTVHTVCSREEFETWNLARFHTADPNCDHCQLNRRRKTTVLVVNDETGEIKQVGKSCLVEYFGIDLAKTMGILMGGFGWGGEDWARHDNAEPWINLLTFVAVCYACILSDGWISRSSVWHTDTQSTSGQAAAQIWHYKRYLQDIAVGYEPAGDVERGYRRVREIEAEHGDFARRAIEWAASPAQESEFATNLAAVASMNGIDPKQMGFAAFIAEGYRRHVERERERALRAKLEAKGASGYFGKPGDWIGRDRNRSKKDRDKGLQSHPAREVTITFIRPLDFSTLIKMVDDAGHVFSWFSTMGTRLKVGDRARMAATVQRHNDFRGIKETMVNRCDLTPVT